MLRASALLRIAGLAGLLVALHERAAVAGDAAPPASGKLACIAADTDGQALRVQGELRKARRRFAGCALGSCPAIVREDCLERIDELAKVQPTVIFAATNGDGRTLHAVKLFMDDELLTEKLDGRPLAVDAGEHRFTFTAFGREGAELTLDLVQGKRVSHAVVLRTLAEPPKGFDPLSDAPAPPAPSPDATPAAPVVAVAPVTRPARVHVAASAGPSPVIDLGTDHGRIEATALGVGALGVIVGSVFGALTIARWHDAQRDCREPCAAGPRTTAAQDEVSDAQALGNVSTVAFVVGGAALAGGALLWLTDRGSSGDAQGLRVTPMVGPDRAQVVLRSRF